MLFLKYFGAALLRYIGGPICAVAFLSACSETDDLQTAKIIADLIVENADIRTADPGQPKAQAFAIKGGRFLAIGSTDDIAAHKGAATKTVDAGGATITPGFVDSHTHLAAGSDLVVGVDLSYVPEKSVWLQRIAKRSAELPPGEWLIGGGWDYTLGEGKYPTKEDIDSVVPDRPVFLGDIDFHSAWANSKALEMAGITADTKAPVGGTIALDPETGEPTGILKEGAMGLIQRLPGLQKDEAQRRAALLQSVRYANSLGITSVHDMDRGAGVEDYLALAEAGDLSVRVWYGKFIGRTAGTDAVAKAAAERAMINQRMAASALNQQQGPTFTFGYLKMMIDGVLSTHTAVMAEPYSDRPGFKGEPFTSQENMERVVAAGNAADFPIAIHAIGDGAVDMVLDAYENAAVKALPAPNRIEHLEVARPNTAARMRALNVVASMQPNHATGTIGKYINDRIGDERENHAYIWKDMLKGGVQLVLGSDWPTSPLGPLTQINDAVFRESPFGLGDGPWHAENALSFDEALRGFTQSGADITAWADEIGSITAGKWADFVILDGALPTPLDRSIRQRSVVATYLAGKAVYEK